LKKKFSNNVLQELLDRLAFRQKALKKGGDPTEICTECGDGGGQRFTPVAIRRHLIRVHAYRKCKA
jgi:hypothetical protein